MKKKLALVLAMLLIISLFAACGGGKTQTTTPPTGQTGGDTDGETTPPEVTKDPDSPYSFAIGQYEKDEDGFPTGSYEYTLPLSTVEDEVFTYWMTCYTPQFIPEEGFGEMPYQAYIREKTGVNIEYQVINSQAMSENFSVMINADDLSDLISGFMFYYSGTPKSAIEDGYIVNLLDYRDYMPNYMYQAVRFDDIDVMNTIFYDAETVLSFMAMLEEPMPGMNYCARGDWLAKLGMDPNEIITYDDVHEMLSRFKNELGVQWPMEMFKSVEPSPSMIFAGYDTAMYVTDMALPTVKVVDGVPTFTLAQQEDYEALLLIRQWLDEGLIDPAWNSISTNQDMTSQITTGVTGYVAFNPGEIKGFEDASTDPDAEWAALPKVRKVEGQAFKMGSKLGHFSYGSCAISATCANIPLLVTYCDYFYSPEGSFSASYGVEGFTWEYNEEGEIRLTDFVLNNPDGLGVAWVMIMNAINSFVDPGIDWHTKNYAYDGGERLLNMMKITWAEPNYTGEYDWPTSLKFTDEQSTLLNEVRADVITYINENFLTFVDGSKPLSEWDTYVAEAKSIGLDACQAIYQEAYDAFMAKFE